MIYAPVEVARNIRNVVLELLRYIQRTIALTLQAMNLATFSH